MQSNLINACRYSHMSSLYYDHCTEMTNKKSSQTFFINLSTSCQRLKMICTNLCRYKNSLVIQSSYNERLEYQMQKILRNML